MFTKQKIKTEGSTAASDHEVTKDYKFKLKNPNLLEFHLIT